MSESRPSIVAIFNAALELPPERRAAYPEAACAGDAPLRHRVEALLLSYESAGTVTLEP